jgi:hypothetical protein
MFSLSFVVSSARSNGGRLWDFGEMINDGELSRVLDYAADFLVHGSARVPRVRSKADFTSKASNAFATLTGEKNKLRCPVFT